MSRGDQPDLSDLFGRFLLSAAAEAASSGTRSNDYETLNRDVSMLLKGNRAKSIEKREEIAQQMIVKSPAVEDAKKYAKANLNFKLAPDEIHLRSLILNLTDSSASFCRHVAESGYLELVLEELKLPALCQTKLDRNGDAKEHIHFNFVYNAFSIVFNCLFHYPRTKQILNGYLRNSRSLESIITHLKTAKDERMQTVIVMVLAETGRFEKIPDNQDAIEKCIKFALTHVLEPAREKESEGETSMFSVDQILHSLKAIAKNDLYAEQLVKLGIFDTMRKILPPNEQFGDCVTKICLLMLLQISFTSSQELKDNRLLMKQVKALQSLQSTPEISEAAKGILLSVDESSNEQSEKFPVSNEVMISYCQTDQTLAFKLKDALLKGGINVLIDAKKMLGTAVEKMIEGVQASQIIIVLVSEAYSDDEYCRSEATYAHKLGKKLIYALAEAELDTCGWMEGMMGDELFYDVAARFERDTEKLVHRLKNLLK